MKKVNVVQLIASICMLLGCCINLADTITKIPFELKICALPLLLVAIVLYGIEIVQKIKIKKQNQKKNDENT